MDPPSSRQSIVLVCVGGGCLRSSCVCWWWGSLCRLVTRPLTGCLGRLFPRQWHVPHVPAVLCMWFFLSPGSSRSGRGSVSRHILHSEVPILQLLSKLASGSCLFLVWFVFSWPARRSCSKLCNKLWGSCLKIWSQTVYYQAAK